MRYQISALITLVIFVGSVRADTLAYTAAAATQPNQSFAGNFGMDFTTNTQITVTGLGLYSSNFATGGSGFSGDNFVTLFKSDGTVVAQLELGNGTGNGTLFPGSSDYVKPLQSPLVLPSGFSGSIVAHYGNGTDELNNVGAGGVAPAETGSPALTYTGLGRYTVATNPNTYPDTADGGPPNRYNGPTFTFTVPEPSCLSLLGLSLLGLIRRSR